MGVSAAEVQSMDAFRDGLVRCIVGDVVGSSWKNLMLQAVNEEPALCNAIVAFSALCNGHDVAARAMTAWDPLAVQVSPDVRLAVRNYACPSKMHHVRSVNAVLLCSVVCLCFELLMNSPDIALRHLEHCLCLLSRNAEMSTFA
jgi:hypothetical protein